MRLTSKMLVENQQMLVLFIFIMVSNSESQSLEELISDFNMTTNLGREKRYLTFPEGSAMGFIVAFAVPIESYSDVMFSWNFEGNYNLPWENRHFDLRPPQDQRTFPYVNRTSLYTFIKNQLDNMGIDGNECFLRLICDVSQTPISHNGLIGNLLHILLTPSTSEDENLNDEHDAEQYGRQQFADCTSKYNCSISLIDRFSFLVDENDIARQSIELNDIDD